jgi:hypothetical protein
MPSELSDWRAKEGGWKLVKVSTSGSSLEISWLSLVSSPAATAAALILAPEAEETRERTVAKALC